MLDHAKTIVLLSTLACLKTSMAYFCCGLPNTLVAVVQCVELVTRSPCRPLSRLMMQACQGQEGG